MGILDFFNNLFGVDSLGVVFRVVKAFWPFVVFPFIFILTKSTWLFLRQSIYKSKCKYTVLEMLIPREILKSPQAMEQVLTGMHSLRNAPGKFNEHLSEKYWEGEVTNWFTLEFISIGGDVHFYIRCLAKRRALVEASFFSYYSDIELVEVPDYVSSFPKNTGELDEQSKEIFGGELTLSKEAAYPIKTYVDFESPDDAKKFDPASTFLEIMSKIKKGEFAGIQIIIAPADYKWYKQFEKVLEKLKLPKVEKTEDEFKKLAKLYNRSPGETDIIKAVEKNFSKPAFDTIIRILYMSDRGTFSDNFARKGIIGAFSQYSALNLNSFRQNYKAGTRTQIWNPPYLFAYTRARYRKNRFLNYYLNREVAPETWMGKLITSYIWNWNFASKYVKMNTEAIASIYHPPTNLVLTAPHIKRVESKKASPSAGMPIFGDDKDIEMFMPKKDKPADNKPK